MLATKTNLITKQQGFTLIEVLAVVAVLALVANVLVPSMGNLITKNQLVSASNQVQAGLIFARAEARRLKETTSVSITGSNLIIEQEDLGTIKIYEIDAGVTASISPSNLDKIEFLKYGNRQTSTSDVFITVSKEQQSKLVEVCFNGRVVTRKKNGSKEC